MTNFGKKREDQLFYQNCKLERANQELVDRINKELIPALNAQQAEINKQRAINNSNLQLIGLLLFELGGEHEAQIADLEAIDCTIKAIENKETMTVKFCIESAPEAPEEGETRDGDNEQKPEAAGQEKQGSQQPAEGEASNNKPGN